MFGTKNNDDDRRFEIVYSQNEKIAGMIRILRDRETGVCYLNTWIGAAGSVTPLLDAEGRVVVTPESPQP